MNCAEARLLLTRRLREPLPSNASAALDAHLAGCPGCRAEGADLEKVDGLLAAARQPVPQVGVDTQAILRTGAAPALGYRPVLALAAATALCAVLYFALRPHVATHEQSAQSSITVPAPRPKTEIQKPAATPHRPATVPVTPDLGLARPAKQLALNPPARVKSAPAPPRQLTQRMKEPGMTPLVPALQQAEKPALQAVALKVEEPVARVFSGESALAKRVTLDARDRPLRDLLPEWSRTLGVKLGASRSTGDDKVTLLVKDRPAGETLTLLAKHFGFQWMHNTGAYELTQDIATQREEEGLRRAELRPIQEQLDFVTAMLKLPKDQLQARLKEIQLRERAEDAAPEEKAKLAAERQNVTNAYLGRDVVEASLALFRSLNPAQINALLGGTDLHFSSATGTLPAPIADKVYDSTSILESQYGALPRLQADATIRLTDVEDEDEVPPPRKGRQFRLRFHYATRRGSKEDLKMWDSEWSPALPAAPEPPPTPEALQDPILNRVVELDLPGPMKPHVHILGGGLIGAAALGQVWPQWATVADVAAALNRATGLEIISDSFIGARIEPNLLRGKHRVGELLQILAAELDYRWTKTGNVVFLRSRRYYAERPAEVPQRIIDAFRDRVQATNQLSLDELSALAAAIDDPQARSMFRYWGWYLQDTGIIPTDYFYPHREHLRFWASLTRAQRKLVQSGQVLAVNQMTPVQQRLWATAFTSQPDSARDTATAMRQPAPQEIAAGGFSLGQKQVQNVIWIITSPDGKHRNATGVMVEGPRTEDVSKFMHFPPGMEPPTPSPQESLDGYDFNYHLAGEMKPTRTVRILIPRPRKGRPH